MRSLPPSFFTLFWPLLVVANGCANEAHRVGHQARQATTAPGVIIPPSPTGGAAVGSSSSAGPALPTTTYTFSLQATNPTAVPLSMITGNQDSIATRPLALTAAVGAMPTFISGAPALPDGKFSEFPLCSLKFISFSLSLVGLISPANYPPLDRPPPTDSPEVQQWKQEVANSGITIPDLAPTNLGGCANNSAFAADSSRCWWTCSGCTRAEDITQCPDPMQWGLTYDDGPGFYTSNLLQYLDENNLKSTFFVVGSRAISFPHILQTQYMGEHQIAVHTWSHPPLTTQTTDQIIAELGWSKKIIKDVLGVTPNMMRPPFGDIDDRVRAICLAMGLTPVMWTRTSAISTFDTEDFSIHSGVTPVQKVLQNWENIINSATSLNHGFIVLEHDLFQESVEVATGYILPDAVAHNPPFKIQPVIKCLGKSLSDGYLETNNNTTNTHSPTGSMSGSTGSTGSGSQTPGSKSDAGRQYQLNPGVISAVLLGVAGFAAGLFTISRL